MNLQLCALCLVVAIGVAVAFRSGTGPASAFVAVSATMVAIQGSMLAAGPQDPLPYAMMLAFLAIPLFPGLLAAILFPPDDGS